MEISLTSAQQKAAEFGCKEYNDSLPQVHDPAGNAIVPNPNAITAEQYLQVLVDDMLKRLVLRYHTDTDLIDKQIAELEAHKARITS